MANAGTTRRASCLSSRSARADSAQSWQTLRVQQPGTRKPEPQAETYEALYAQNPETHMSQVVRVARKQGIQQVHAIWGLEASFTPGLHA